MSDTERENALKDEAAALDRQLVDYVVQILAKKQFSEAAPLSARVKQSIDDAFSQAAATQRTAVEQTIGAELTRLVAALEAHRMALAQSGIGGDRQEGTDSRGKRLLAGDSPTGDELQKDEPDSSRLARSDLDPVDSGLRLPKRLKERPRLLAGIGTFAAVAAIIGLGYLYFAQRAATEEACNYIAQTNERLGKSVKEIDKVVTREEYAKLHADAANAATQAAGANLREQAVLTLSTTNSTLSELRDDEDRPDCSSGLPLVGRLF